MRRLVHSSATAGRAIRDARRRRALTQQQLAILAGVSQVTISCTERGVHKPSLDTLLKILSALELEVVIQERRQVDPAAAWDTAGK